MQGPEEVCIDKNSRDLFLFVFYVAHNLHFAQFGIGQILATWPDRLQKRKSRNSKARVGTPARRGDARLRRFEHRASWGLLHHGVPMSVALVNNFVWILGRVFVDRVLHGFFSGPAAVDEQQVSIELFDSQVTKLFVPRV